jgi:hypothetical protein
MVGKRNAHPFTRFHFALAEAVVHDKMRIETRQLQRDSPLNRVLEMAIWGSCSFQICILWTEAPQA